MDWLIARRLTAVGWILLVSIAGAAASARAAAPIFLVDSELGVSTKIYRINQTSGQLTTLGALGIWFGEATGLAAATPQQLYVSTLLGNIIRVDLSPSFATTTLGNVGGGLAGLQWDAGKLYGIDETTDELCVLGLAPLTKTVIGKVKLGSTTGPTVDIVGGDLTRDDLGNWYMFTNAVDASQYRLYALDVTTAVATLIGPWSHGRVSGLAFDSTGTGVLYAATRDTNKLLTLNPKTGAVNSSVDVCLYCPTGFDLRAGDLAVPPPTASPVATASGTATATRTTTALRSATPTRSAPAALTATATRTATPAATSTVVATRSATATASSTAPPTPTPTGNPAPTGTATPRATASATATVTLAATASPTAVPSQTAVASPTAPPSHTASPPRTATDTVPPSAPPASPTTTAIPSPTPRSTDSPAASPTGAPPSPTPTPPTVTAIPSGTSRSADTPSPSPAASPTHTSPPTPTATPIVCLGDCNGDGQVTVDELINGVGIALGDLPLSTCPVFDGNASGDVTIDELILAQHHALDGC